MDIDSPIELDPIDLALVQKQLDHISQQMGWVMTRTARSPIFSQSHDFSCFITDAQGFLVSQADGIPIHTGGGGFAVRCLIRVFTGSIAEGDAFLLNDPYLAGGNHLPDWLIARPVFVAGELVAFACNRAHQSDIGGGAAGTYNPEATEIFHEGIRLPPLRLIEAGETRQDLWQLLLANTRSPELLDGDLRAMLGSTRIGTERVADLVAALGVAEGRQYLDGILDHADRRMRAMIAELPDGVYRGEDGTNNDCFVAMEIPVRVTMTVAGDTITVDFMGTASQMRGFKNSPHANTHSAVYMALAAFFDPDLPHNEGTFRAVEIVAAEGTVVNPRPPAATTMCTAFVSHEIIYACWKALGKADPARSLAGWGKQMHPLSSGQQSENEPFIMYHWNMLPGAGAVDGRDGFNEFGTLVTLGGLALPNIEVYEQLYPVRFGREEFREDGGGTGAYRGGTGVDYEVEIRVPSVFSFRGEGLHDPSGYGVGGGGFGACGEMTVVPADGEPFTAPQYGIRDVGPVRLVASSPGGGGWGDPLAREQALVLRDVRDGVVSRRAAAEVYGVVLTDDGRDVDTVQTARRRAALQKDRRTTEPQAASAPD